MRERDGTRLPPECKRRQWYASSEEEAGRMPLECRDEARPKKRKEETPRAPVGAACNLSMPELRLPSLPIEDY